MSDYNLLSTMKLDPFNIHLVNIEKWIAIWSFWSIFWLCEQPMVFIIAPRNGAKQMSRTSSWSKMWSAVARRTPGSVASRHVTPRDATTR